MTARQILLLIFASCLLPAAAAGAALDDRPLSLLRLDESAGTTRVWVDVADSEGGVRRVLLRETDGEVVAGKTGGDPAGKATFATWDEDGERWFSYSRDAGRTWSTSRRLRTELRLRDGEVEPGAPMPRAGAELELPETGRLFLVQFATAGLPEWREALAALGAQILSYVPHNAHIVRAGRENLPDLLALEFVERVEPYHPWYRIGPETRDWLSNGAPGGSDLLRIRAMTPEWGPVAKQRVIEKAEALGARVADYWPSGHIVELWVDRAQLRSIAALDDVVWIDRWTPREQDMDLVREDAGTNFVENSLGYCGQGVRGEVLDGGIQVDHPDFDGILLHGSTGLDSHGTATYGIVFGNGDRDGDGDGKGTGHMPCGEGIFAAYPSLTDRFVHTEELKQAPYFASFQSNSWGDSLTTAYTSVSHDLDDIIWRLDIAIAQSQSNNGNQLSRPQAWAKNVISVGGIRHYDTLDTSDDAWAGGASVGPAADGRIKPDVSYWYDDVYTTTTGSDYTTNFGGTSAATPETAGTLGLIVQMWADDVWETDPQGATVFDRQPHFSTLKALLINNAQQYDFTGSNDDLTRTHQGWGRPSARVAFERASRSLVVDEEDVLALGESSTFSVVVEPGETELKATLVYPDPPGTTSSSLHRINDVNLTVTSPSATFYRGNVGLSDGTESTSGGSPNDLDTVENVFVRNPEAGTWVVEVEALEVNQDGYLATPEDDVTFALVVTGAREIYSSGLGQVRVTPGENGCDQPFQLRVLDGNAGTSTVTVNVRSDTETAPESVVLQETGSGSGEYTGQVPTTSGAPVAGDGIVSAADGDVLTVEYVDADDGQGGTDLPREDSATLDCLPPVISLVQTTGITDTEATITWTTDEPSDSSVSYDSVTPPNLTAPRAGSTTTHSVRLHGLQECTAYYFSVESTDALGNSAQDDNGGTYFNFVTLTDAGGELQSCRDGRLVLEADGVSCSTSLIARLTDLDLNLDIELAETVPVFFTSSTETTPEIAILTETGPNTATFTGSISTGPGAVVAGDGILQTADGDLVTARSDDADDGMGGGGTSFDTVVADCSGADFASLFVTPITDDGATIVWTTTEPTTGRAEWGATPALGNQATSDTLKTTHSANIGPIAECGRVHFRVVATDAYANGSLADAGGVPFEFNALGVTGSFHRIDFESDTGWTLEGEWEIGEPMGLGSFPGDPSAASEGTGVLGQDLSGQGANPGDYEPDVTESAISPVIDATGLANAELNFDRWLNMATGSFAYVDVMDSEGAWQNVWTGPSVGGLTDSAWSAQIYDISAYADGNPDLQIRYRLRSLISSSFDAGWNVDRIILRDGSLPPIDVCGECAGAPTFGGLASAVDDDPCADSGVTLSWTAAPAWGTGSSGSYAVYRDTQPGFSPGPANLQAGGVTATTWTDPAVPNDETHYYVVRAENDETCGGGPANGGVVDANLAYAAVQDSTSQAAPGDVGNALRVDGVNKAHARLSWTAAPGAAAYNVYRSGMPDATFGLHAVSEEILHDDADVFGDGQLWYYLVRAADACGNESAD